MNPSLDVLERGAITLFSRFLEEYGHIQCLSSECREDFIMHDVRGFITPIEALMGFLSPRLNNLIRKGNEESGHEAMEKLAVFGELIEESPVFLSEHPLDTMSVKLARIAARLPALQRVFPILYASAVFLEQPNQEGYQKLTSLTTDLATLAQVFGIGIDPKDNIDINGIEAIIYFNLLNNAKNRGQGEVEVFKMFDGKVRISNSSITPITDDCLNLGVKGENGGSGYGLFIVGLYKTLGNISVSINSQELPPGNFLVSCIVGRPQLDALGSVQREREVS